MDKEIKDIDKTSGVVRITTLGERWYARPEKNSSTGLPQYTFYPSSTWIASYYPKGVAFYKWLASKGWDEAQAIKEAAGNRGSIVHQASELLEKTGELPITTPFLTPDGAKTELGTEEIECLFSFKKWHDKNRPKLLANEMTVFGEDYAGTLDRIYEIDGQVWIVDLKTSQEIWEEHKLQIASYNHASISPADLGISNEKWGARKLAALQLGYGRNKDRFKFSEIEDKYDLFRMAKAIWDNENQDAKPKEREYPMTIRINQPEEADNGTEHGGPVAVSKSRKRAG